MRQRARRALWGIAGLVVVGWLASGALASYWLVARHSPTTREEPPPWATDGQFEEVRLTTHDGHDVGAWFVQPRTPRRKEGVVLFLHGWGVRRTLTNASVAKTAHHGYTSMNLSFRGHGDSSGDRCDLGWSGRADVVAAVEFLEARVPGEPIVIVGTSMGAAAAIFAAEELGDRVQGYWLGAPYRDLESAAWDRCVKMFPPVLDGLAYAGLKLWTPLWLETDVELIRPIDHVGSIPTSAQVVFTVGELDVESPVEDVRELEAACPGNSRLVIYPDIGHEGLEARDFEGYMELVLAFVDETLTMER